MELRRSKDAATRPARREHDTVGWYLSNIKDHEVLKHEALVALFKEFEAGDKSAFNKIVRQNLKLVVAVARGYRDKGVDWEDLLQEGNLGLIHAVEKFDWRRGHRFSTYATWWIRQRISHYLSTQRHSIRVPTHALRLKKHIELTIEKLRKEGDQEPSWERIAEIVGGSPDVVEATVAGSRATVSLSQPETSAERESLEPRFRTDGESTNAETTFSFQEVRDTVVSAIDSLDPLDKRIVELRLGKGWP